MELRRVDIAIGAPGRLVHAHEIEIERGRRPRVAAQEGQRRVGQQTAVFELFEMKTGAAAFRTRIALEPGCQFAKETLHRGLRRGAASASLARLRAQRSRLPSSGKREEGLAVRRGQG